MKAEATAPSLIFDWPRREGFPFVLFACVAASLFAHAATFFLFQVNEPLGTSIPRTPPQVSVLTPSSPEAIALLHWIDAQDPALVATANSITPPGLFDLAYRPSYATPRTLPLGPVEQPVVVSFPAAREPLAIITSTAPKITPAPAAHTSEPTIARFAPSLASRAPTPPPPLIWKTRASSPVEPAHFLLAVTDRGEVRFLFLQNSSGNPALDEHATAWLQNFAFAANEAPITWATATVTWGDDAFAANQQSGISNQQSP